eukprot:TRINITY_DN11424_c0_g1_i1.p1 TRINITY_DN11424_c0_g1~~TRINITY_DN11424_c0_g1_i1.p1  ORF type:complete len:389 (+),score=123.16 TRINITY_DN11424_c0_g1_i1:48-1169(+)
MADSLKRRLVKVLDFDGDGELGVGDIRASLIKALDQDGDGQLTAADLEIAQKRFGLWIETAEEAASVAAALWRRHGEAARIGSGVFLLLYGPCLQYTVKAVQTFRISGWPVIQRASKDLHDYYWWARVRINEELSDPQKAAAVAAAEELASDAAAGRRPKGDKEKLRTAKQLSTVVSSLQIVAKAAEPQKVMEILKGLYISLLACVSSMRLPGVATVSVGASVGQSIADSLVGFALPLLRAEVRRRDPDGRWPDSVVKWAETALRGLCSALSCMVAYRVELFIRRLDHTMLAARLLTDNLVELASRREIPVISKIKAGTQAHTLLMWVLTAIGLFSQFSKMPLLLRIVLFIPLKLEAMLAAADVASAVAGPAK